MDYDKLNAIVDECMDYYLYKENLDILFKKVIPLCKKVLEDEKYKTVSSDNFSIDYNLNEKLKLISNFFKELDSGLYHQFETLISSVDENEKPIINFVYNEDVKNSNVDRYTGKVYINLKNNFIDMFVIIHELLHCMNYCIIETYEGDKIDKSQPDGKDLLSESASIIVEKLFGQWLVKNGFITQNDYNLKMNLRLESTKENAKKIIMEAVYIILKQDGKKITKENLEKCKNYMKDFTICKIIEEELEKNTFGKAILNQDMLMFPVRQKYIIAYDMLNDYDLDQKGILNFLELQKLLGEPESKLNKYI